MVAENNLSSTKIINKINAIQTLSVKKKERNDEIIC